MNALAKRIGRVGLVLLLCAVALTSTSWAASKATQYLGFPVVSVKANGQVISSDVPAIVVEGRTMLPVRAVADALGLTVTWDEATQTVSLTALKPGPTYVWVDMKKDGWQQDLDQLARDRRYDGAIVSAPRGLGVMSSANLALAVDGKLSAEQFAGRVQWYAPDNANIGPSDSTPASSTPASGMCVAIHNTMAIQTDRIFKQATDSQGLGKRIWGHVVEFWTPVLNQQNCTIPTSRSDLGEPVQPKDTLECSGTRAVVEERRRKDVSAVRAKLAGNGTLGGSPEADLLWEANLNWDTYLLKQGCSL